MRQYKADISYVFLLTLADNVLDTFYCSIEKDPILREHYQAFRNRLVDLVSLPSDFGDIFSQCVLYECSDP